MILSINSRDQEKRSCFYKLQWSLRTMTIKTIKGGLAQKLHTKSGWALRLQPSHGQFLQLATGRLII